MDKPILARRIFWDIDFDKIDYDARAAFVIERVFERGDVDDVRQVKRYYGDDFVRDTLLKAKWLSLPTIYLASALFLRKPSDFTCYTKAQSNPQHWIY